MASERREEASTLTSTYHELSKIRKVKLFDLLNESEKLHKLLLDSTAENVTTVRNAHKYWLNLYENFLHSNSEYQGMLSPAACEMDQKEIKSDCDKLETLRMDLYSWFTKNTEEDSRSQMSRGSSSTSNKSSQSYRLKESTRKAELLARQAALEETRKIDQEKLNLKYKEENLKLKTELSVTDAKTKVIDDLEKSMLHDNNLENDIQQYMMRDPTNLTQQASNEHMADSDPNYQNLGLVHITQVLNKPKVEIIKFQGNPMDYHRFIRQFKSKILKNTSCNDEIMTFLLQYTTGEANKIATGYSHLRAEIGVKATLREFRKRYGDSDVVADSYVKKALEWPNVRNDDPKALDAYNIFLVECQYAVENVSSARVLDYQDNIQKIVKKLPYGLQERWRNVVFNLKECHKQVTFEELVKFVRKEAKKANDPIFGRAVLTTPQMPVSRNRPPRLSQGQRKSFGTYAQPQTESSNMNVNTPKCDYYSKAHWISSCSEIIKKTLKERYEILKSKGLCYSCLRRGHQKLDCRRKLKCNFCQRFHPTILHVDRQQYSPEAALNQQTNDNSLDPSVTKTSGATAIGAGTRKVLPIVPVYVRQKDSNNSVRTYAFLDSGSNTTFCTESLIDKLGIEGRKRNIYVQTLTGKQKQSSYCVSNLEVLPLDGLNSVDLPEIYTQPSLPVNVSDLITETELRNWPHLNDIPLHPIESEVELLIGVDVPKAMEPWDVLPSENNGPFAVKTLLGWVVNGPLHKDNSETSSVQISKSNFIHADHELNQIIIQQHNRDFNERIIDDVEENSKDDIKFIKIVESSVEKNDNKYTINLPFKNENSQMPNNKIVAKHRLTLLKKRLENDEKLKNEYTEFMDKVISKGYAKKVDHNEEADPGREWYLPHHAVRHPKKDKLRVVFDCSARFQGTSLNDELLQGPNLTNSLVGTLIRFREEDIAIVGDIESMYYQVQVTEKDTNFLKFLWFEDSDITKAVIEYKMVVHLFGAKSSPSCANFALRKTAIDQSDKYDSQVINTVLRNFYVDDCLKSVANVEIAKHVVQDLQSLLLKGGFRIHKWLSSSREVMSTIPTVDRAVNLDLDQDTLPIDRALGVQWCVESDEFCFKIDIKDKPLTRRGMLSMISTVYDPLGFLAPLMLRAKNILKELCRLGLGWDDPVPDEVAKRWTIWLNDMHKLSEFSVARCLKPPGFGKVRSATLHHFADASEIGYGTVSYLRLINSDDEVHCAFVMGKSRVAPMKQITVPRLELTAATVAVRTDKMLKSEFDLELNDSVFSSDSMAVLRYINNSSSRFHTFVANRLAVIHDGSSPQQWRYVNTKLNPADIASRGIEVDDIVLRRGWIVAPDFLWGNEDSWPESQLVTQSDSDDPEVKKTNVTKSVADNVLSLSAREVLDKLMSYFSSWYKLKRAVAWILRVRKKLLDRLRAKKVDTNSKGNYSDNDKSSYVTVNDMNRAERAILSYTQKCAFPEETSLLVKKGSNVKKNSVIRNLDPVMEDGLLRVGGRLQESKMPENAKHPVILPKNSEVSKLIVREIHERLNHVGRNHTLSIL